MAVTETGARLPVAGGDGSLSRCRGHPLDYEENHISEPRINDRIRVPEVRLVGPNGEQVGIVRVEDALRLAAEADLDLVEVAPTARPPVCKLMDFGKFKYESAMKEREARRNQTNTVIKEIKLRPKIDPHDYGTKKGHVERFLKAGDKVKVTIMFRGREQSRPASSPRPSTSPRPSAQDGAAPRPATPAGARPAPTPRPSAPRPSAPGAAPRPAPPRPRPVSPVPAQRADAAGGAAKPADPAD